MEEQELKPDDAGDLASAVGIAVLGDAAPPLTYEDAALASKAAWDAGDFERAAAHLSKARALVVEKGRVDQGPDGTLRLLPHA